MDYDSLFLTEVVFVRYIKRHVERNRWTGMAGAAKRQQERGRGANECMRHVFGQTSRWN
jgi:hypothetical protein